MTAYGDLSRPPLHEQSLRRTMLAPSGPLSGLDVVEATGSTNADLAERFRRDPSLVGDRTLLVTEHQQAGRGRLGRTWSTPSRSALTFSLLLRPAPRTENGWPWYSLLAGLAVTRVLRTLAGIDADLKWPNDVLVGGAKVAGILGEIVHPAPPEQPALVIGIGLNVSLNRAELDALGLPEASSLLLTDAECTDRAVLLRALTRQLCALDEQLRAAGGDAEASGLAAEVREHCLTVGTRVVVHRPGGEAVPGVAEQIDSAGRLVVRGPAGPFTVAAGDVQHLRPEEATRD